MIQGNAEVVRALKVLSQAEERILIARDSYEEGTSEHEALNELFQTVDGLWEKYYTMYKEEKEESE